MVLVFIILGIIIVISIINLILMLSNVKLEILKLHIYNNLNKVEIDVLINVSIYFLNKFKIFKIRIDKEKISNKLKLDELNLTKLINDRKRSREVLNNVKKLSHKIEYFKLDGYFSTFNTVLTSNVFAIVCSLIPILVAPKVDGKYINKLKPLNINQNTINVNLNCIISTKIVNIINILHLNSKYLKSIAIAKKGGKSVYGRSSNRRINAYSNE